MPRRNGTCTSLLRPLWMPFLTGSSGRGKLRIGAFRLVIVAEYLKFCRSYVLISSETGKVEAPMWSYQLGLQQGWIPKNPRSSIGYCNNAGINAPWNPPFKPWQTGGAGAGTVDPAFVSSFGAWPPQSLSGVDNVNFAPTYTATGPIPTLPPPVYTLRNGSTISGGSGWFDKADNAGAPVNISGCTYPDPYAQTPIPLPTTTCGGKAGRRGAPPLPRRTQPPAA